MQTKKYPDTGIGANNGVPRGDGHDPILPQNGGAGQYHNGANDPGIAILSQLPPEERERATALALAIAAKNRGGESPHNDDTGNAERFVAQHGENVRYVHTWGRWLLWAGTHWMADDTGRVHQLAKQTARQIYGEAAAAAAAGNDAGANTLAKWARASGSASRRAAMLTLAQSEPPIAITHENMDQNPLLVACANGTIDLATGDLRPSNRADLITRALPVPYDPAATCPMWHEFLKRIMPDAVMRDFLQRAVGVTISGQPLQALVFLYGNGANGKSTFMETLLALFGDYATKTRAETLLTNERGGNVPNDVAALVGKRLVVASELSEGRRLNEALVKDLTGGDTISARFLRQEFFNFRPQFKLWMYGNHKPVITGTDDGIWRRILLVPFAVQIPQAEQDRGLPDRLRAELPGILAWAVAGWQQYQTAGLNPPTAVSSATDGYRSESDVLGQFLAECTIQGDGLRAAGGDLYNCYKTWTEENGLGTLSNPKFARQLMDRGFSKGAPTTRERRIWQGIGILADGE